MKKIVLLAIVLCSIGYTEACDICGCYMGVTPYKNYSSIGIFYRYRSFNGYSIANQPNQLFPSSVFRTSGITHGGDEPIPTGANIDSLYPSKDYEVYRVYELRAKYFVHKRVEVNAIVPLYFNSSRRLQETEQVKGIGDINIFLGYHLISRQDRLTWKSRLVVGSGIKMRTGNFYLTDKDNFRFDPLLQPGTGSNDWLMYANYMVGYKNIGLNSTALYKVNGKNSYDERIANSITTYANLFYVLRKGNVQVIPSLQFYQEYTKGLYREGEFIPSTTMSEVMLGPGVDMLYKGVMLSLALQRTLYSAAASTDPGSAGRFVLGLSYNILQKKHLFKSKKTES